MADPLDLFAIDKIIERTNKTIEPVLGSEKSILKKINEYYASSGKVFAITEKGEYTLRLRLYELEERLDQNRFVRISNSEIINLKKVKRFDLSLTGTICVSLSDGAVTYVSRRYVSKIKQVLGV